MTVSVISEYQTHSPSTAENDISAILDSITQDNRKLFSRVSSTAVAAVSSGADSNINEGIFTVKTSALLEGKESLSEVCDIILQKCMASPVKIMRIQQSDR